jgi:hypothetical protein
VQPSSFDHSRLRDDAYALGVLPRSKRIRIRHEERIEAQIERFARDFAWCWLDIMMPLDLERHNANPRRRYQRRRALLHQLFSPDG